MNATQKAGVLFIICDGKPILQQDDSASHQHFFKFRDCPKELFVFILIAKPHDPLNPCAVVPTSVKQYDFACCRQVRYVSLKVPLCAFSVVRCRKRCYPANTWIKSLGNALDNAPFSCGIASFKKNHHFLLAGYNPVLEFDKFAL